MVTRYNFIEKNPHPQGLRTRDCVKRACVLASGVDYHDIVVMLNRYKKVTGATKFNTNDNWRKFIVNVLGGRDQGNMQYINQGHRFQVWEYAEKCKHKAILQVAGHLVAIDGKGHYLDTWDCGEKSIYKVYWLDDYETIVAFIKKNHPKLCKGLTLERYRARISLL